MTKFYRITENVLGASIGACVVIYIIKVIKNIIVLIKPSEMLNFHEQRVIIPEGMVRIGPLLNLKKI